MTYSPIKLVFEMKKIKLYTMKYLIRYQSMSITKEFVTNGNPDTLESCNDSSA